MKIENVPEKKTPERILSTEEMLYNTIANEEKTLWQNVKALPMTPFENIHESLQAIVNVGLHAEKIQALRVALTVLRELATTKDQVK